MQATELLTQRSAMPRLQAPAPSSAQLELMFRAAARAPDHMQLMPYRFMVFEQSQLAALGQLFADAAKHQQLADVEIERAQQLPLRAPLVIASIACYQQHDKVPQWEQLASAACATSMLQQAAFAQGLGAIWRTGWLTESRVVRHGLGLAANEAIIGFMYVGTAALKTPIKPDKDWSVKVQYWGR
jgi:nitroreductase